MSRLETRWLEVNDPEWTAFLGRNRFDFYHLPGYVDLEAREGCRPVAVLTREGEKELFLPLLLQPVGDRGDQHASSPYGYPGPLLSLPARTDPEFAPRALARLLEAMREEGIVTCFVRLHPVLSPDLAIPGTAVRHGQTVSVDLTAPEAEQWRQVRKDHKLQINKSRRTDLEAVFDNGVGALAEFRDIYHETMRRVNAAERYFLDPGYLERLHQALDGRLWTCRVVSQGITLCAGLFPETAGLVQFHLSGTRDEAIKSGPSKFMLDSVRRWAAARGNYAFHLGGGVGSSQDNLFDFKAGFSHRRHRFVTWRFVLDPDRYAKLIERLAPGHEPDDLGGHFPPFGV